MNLIERLYQYLEYKSIKPAVLERELGLSNGYLGTMKKRKASVGSEIAQKIVDYFPELDPVWLLTGQGDMINSLIKVRPVELDPLTIYKRTELPPGPCQLCLSKEAIIKAQQDTIDALKEALVAYKARDKESDGQKRKKVG